MGFFSKLFGGKAEDGADAQALKKYFDASLPREYVNSPKYSVTITQSRRGYEARITLDMTADGSDYTGFAKEDFTNLADLESDRVYEMLTNPPVTVYVTFDADFGGRNIITVKM